MRNYLIFQPWPWKTGMPWLRRFESQAFAPDLSGTTSHFPSFGRGFDSHRPLQKSAKFTLIRLPLLTRHPSICAHKGGVLRPNCTQVLFPALGVEHEERTTE